MKKNERENKLTTNHKHWVRTLRTMTHKSDMNLWGLQSKHHGNRQPRIIIIIIIILEEGMIDFSTEVSLPLWAANIKSADAEVSLVWLRGPAGPHPLLNSADLHTLEIWADVSRLLMWPFTPTVQFCRRNVKPNLSLQRRTNTSDQSGHCIWQQIKSPYWVQQKQGNKRVWPQTNDCTLLSN